MINHVLFDCFGTLIDTGAGSVNAVKKILKNINLSVEPDNFYSEWKALKKELMNSETFLNEKRLFELSLQEMFDRYGVNSDAHIEVSPMIETLFAKRDLFPETKETLAKLNELGIDYAIGSTTDTDSIMHYLRTNNLSVERVFTSEDMQVYKPLPEFYLIILEKTGWNVDECIFVGDNLVDDILGPQKVGMKTVLIDRKHKYTKQEEITPDYVVDSLRGIFCCFIDRTYVY